jgi:MinD superfamily P-loop ATPase
MRKKIAIASGKGGTGKTSVSVNLAAQLSETLNPGSQHVALVDLDVEEPNSLLFFTDAERFYHEEESRLVPVWDEKACSLCNKCSKVCEFNAIAFLGTRVLVFPDLCHSCHACSVLCPEDALPMQEKRMGELSYYKPTQSNLSLSEYRLDIGQPSAVPLISSAIKRINQIPGNNQLFLLDAPPGTSCPMMEVVKSSDFILLVTEPTPFGLHDLQIAVETVEKIDRPMAVVLNKAGSGADQIIDDYCELEGIPIIARIPHSRKVAEAYSRGELVYKINDEFHEIFKLFSEDLINMLESLDQK